MKKSFSMLAIVVMTVAGVLTGQAPATAEAATATPVLTQSHSVQASTVTWEDPASTETISGYSVRVNSGWDDPIFVTVTAPRELHIAWGDGAYTLSTPALGEVGTGTGSSVFLEVAAMVGSEPQPAAAALITPGGSSTATTPIISVLSRSAGNLELQLTAGGSPEPAIRDWIVVARSAEGDLALPGAAVTQAVSSDTDNFATATISGLPVSGGLQIFAKGRPSAADSSGTGHTDWGFAVSQPDELTATSVPTVTGDAVVGSTLTVSAGTWEPAPVVLSYAWLRDGQPIIGATGSYYVLTSADLDAVITADVTGTKDGYNAVTVRSDPTVAVAAGTLTATSVPTIAGTPKVGVQLTAGAGTWVSEPESVAYQWLRENAEIVGANGSTYTPTSADMGKKLSVRVTARRAGYTNGISESAPTSLVAQGTMTSSIPAISGTAKVGSTLTAVTGAWGPSPVSFAYQWFRGSTAITGATAATFVPSAADLNAVLKVTVSGTKPGFTTTIRTSPATSVIGLGALTAPAPTISGTVRVGQKLTAAPGAWGPSPVALTHQWYRGGTAITGATASTYVLTPTDLGAAMTLKVTGTKAGYANTTKTSTATAPVARGVFVTGTPTITGTLKVGSTLTVATGAWAPTPAFAYQWYRSGTAISGATGATYGLTAYDLGKTMAVRVTGSKAGYTTAVKTSASTVAVAPGVLSAPTPIISGTRKVGYTLTAIPGTWGPGSVALRYQWNRSGTAITGATAATYKLSVSDAGKVITVKVTGTKTGYTTATKTSAGTTAIVPLTLTSTPVPTISGTAKVGNRLTANAGTWGPAPVTLQYQWYRSGVVISGATAATYVLSSWDVSRTITVKVTGRKTGYSTVVKTSAPTAAVSIYIRISGDKVWAVPSEVPRTTYVTTSKSTIDCYWQTSSEYNFEDYSAVGWSGGNGQRIMEVTGSAVLLGTDQCGSWIRLADMPKAQKTIVPGDGVYSVAKQIVPGVYRASWDGSGECTWGYSDDFAFTRYSRWDYYYTDAPGPFIEIHATDASFESQGCGSWTWVDGLPLREPGARIADDSYPSETGTHQRLAREETQSFHSSIAAAPRG